MTTTLAVSTPPRAQSLSHSTYTNDWLHHKLQQLGKSSVAELSAVERLQLKDEASRNSKTLYNKSLLTSIAVGFLALIIFPAILIVGGIVLLGSLIFAHEIILFPILLGGGIAAYFGITQCPKFFQKYFAEPFQNVRQLQNLSVSLQ